MLPVKALDLARMRSIVSRSPAITPPKPPRPLAERARLIGLAPLDLAFTPCALSLWTEGPPSPCASSTAIMAPREAYSARNAIAPEEANTPSVKTSGVDPCGNSERRSDNDFADLWSKRIIGFWVTSAAFNQTRMSNLVDQKVRILVMDCLQEDRVAEVSRRENHSILCFQKIRLVEIQVRSRSGDSRWSFASLKRSNPPTSEMP